MKITKRQLKRIIKEEISRTLYEGVDPLDAMARSIVTDVVENLEPGEFLDDYDDQPGYNYDAAIEIAEELLDSAEQLVDGVVPPSQHGSPPQSIAARAILDALSEVRYRRDWLDDASEIPGAFDEVPGDDDTYAIEVPIHKYNNNVRKALQGLTQ